MSFPRCSTNFSIRGILTFRKSKSWQVLWFTMWTCGSLLAQNCSNHLFLFNWGKLKWLKVQLESTRPSLILWLLPPLLNHMELSIKVFTFHFKNQEQGISLPTPPSLTNMGVCHSMPQSFFSILNPCRYISQPHIIKENLQNMKFH